MCEEKSATTRTEAANAAARLALGGGSPKMAVGNAARDARRHAAPQTASPLQGTADSNVSAPTPAKRLATRSSKPAEEDLSSSSVSTQADSANDPTLVDEADAPRGNNGATCESAIPGLHMMSSRSKTTAILDWDDTICPSTHLASLGMRVDDTGNLPAGLRDQLAQLQVAVIKIVHEALRFGEVVVITNAEKGWVELSGERFLPDVVKFFKENDIKIVSARTCFEQKYPDAPSSWKVAAFSREVEEMFPQEDDLNVLVLGDSMSERDAAHALGSRMPNSKVKTVKFVERPSIDQLMRQVQLVAQSLPDLAKYSSSFDVDLVVSASS